MRAYVCVRHALTVAVTATVVATALGGAPASGRSAGVKNLPRPAAVGRQVVLVTGDQLMVSPGPGGRSALVNVAAGGRTSMVVLRLGGRTAVIPTDVLRYVGRGLDPSLFDVGLLERAESGGRLPVRVTFGGHRPVLPGVTITRAGRGSAVGYLTASSARLFGAALERQVRGGRARDGSLAAGLLAGGAHLAVAGAPAAGPRVRRPDLPTHTLTVTASNLSGKPDSGDAAWVFDTANLAGFYHETFSGGVARFKVPTGHYWVMGEFDGSDSRGLMTRVDFLPQFAVSRNATVHVAERAAASKVTIKTPRPSLPQVVRFTTVMGGQRGSVASLGWFNAPGTMWVSPVRRKPAVGTLHSYTFEQLTSPARAAGYPYVYNADFRAPAGIIPVPHYRADSPDLATVTERYYQEVRSSGAFFSTGAFPDEGLMAQVLGPLPLPGVQIQYFTANPALLWSSSYFAFGFPLGGQGDDTYLALSPGRQVVDWNRFPLHPQPNWSADGAGGRLIPLIPAAIRSGNRLTLTIDPFSDNELGHRSAGSAAGTKVTERYKIDQNGTQIAHGSASSAGVIPPVTLSQRPSVIRFTLKAARTGPSYRLSTRSQTVWSWRSRRRPGATVPLSWYCAQAGARLVRRCAVQPMMTLDYQVRGLVLNGTVAPGPQLISLRVGHIQVASAARVTGAAAWTSCDGGTSWRRAAVTASGGGNFRLAFSEPAGCYLTLRVRATDAAGGSVAETITHAYEIASRT